MLFYQVGELFQNIATANSRRSVAELMDIRPDTAAVVRNGETLTVDPSEVAVGETIVIMAMVILLVKSPFKIVASI